MQTPEQQLPSVRLGLPRHRGFSRQQVAHGAVVPRPTACGADAPIVQRIGNALKARDTSRLDLPHHRGWDRERSENSAGIRTFPLVAVAACGFVQATERMVNNEPEALARVVEGIIGGIGFIGGGAILKQNGSVRGTATAASLWSTGAVGVAVGLGATDVAIVICGFTFVTLHIRDAAVPCPAEAGWWPILMDGWPSWLLIVALTLTGCAPRRPDFLARVQQDCLAGDQWACDLGQLSPGQAARVTG